jgi:iron complex outermembrane receptor protein/hemoglobin/transferrin/lactoferrin receptor protein
MLAQVNHETVVVGTPLELLDEDDATSTVTRRDLERRLPRSAPDALRYEPGVFVQQTAHAQGSAYLRGLTGQQTVLLFDGIRLNNATYRQGPNQSFFTLDARALEAIEVQRGGASTRLRAQLMAEGHSNRDIGAALGISPKTADAHRMSLMRKLELHDAQALTRYAVRRGLVRDD